MCKEALFINLNHLAVSFSQPVGQKFYKYQKWLFCMEKTYTDSFFSKYIAFKVQISIIRCRYV